jgi:Ca2+-binding EF-hand superfamily protein
VSSKQFRQVLANFGFLMSDEELEALVKTYGNDANEIKYLDFINDATPNKSGTSDFGETAVGAPKQPYLGTT